MGAPQGDCLSPILFTLYLAKALKETNASQNSDHTYHQNNTDKRNDHLPTWIQDHTYSKQKDIRLLITPKYADDISWGAANCIHEIENEKKKITPKLTSRGLIVNESKNEDYDITADGDEKWKKCKLQGSLLDTKTDIKRRKHLANSAYNKLKDVFEDKKLANKQKIRVFRACVESVFLYNGEIWTINKTTNKMIDGYHRRMLRNAINIKWPNKISNEHLYKKTEQKKWSETLKLRRLRWFGHAVRLPEETPAKMALEESKRKLKKIRGGQRTTWLKTIEKDLSDVGYTLQQASEIASERTEWKKVVRSADASCVKHT